MSKQRAKRCVWKDIADPCGSGRCMYGGLHMSRREVLRHARWRRHYWAGRHDWATLATERGAF